MFEKKEKKSNNTFVLLGIIGVLLIIIGVLSFIVGKNYSSTESEAWKLITQEQKNIWKQIETIKEQMKKLSEWKLDSKALYEELSIELIGDKRNEEISLKILEQQLSQQPSMRNVVFTKKDFSDEGVAQYMKDNDIETLPAIIFSTKNFDNSRDPQNLKVLLQNLKDGKYTLPIPQAEYNPFSVSERGFQKVEGDILGKSFIQGNKDAAISILEYTDVHCPYCQKFHKATYVADLLKAFPNDVNHTMKHFPLDMHPQAKSIAQVLECYGTQKWAKGFYSLVDIVFNDSVKDPQILIDTAVTMGGDKTKLEACFKNNDTQAKVMSDLNTGSDKFKVGGTPTIILYNKKTGEYKKATRNLEQDKKIIEKLLK